MSKVFLDNSFSLALYCHKTRRKTGLRSSFSQLERRQADMFAKLWCLKRSISAHSQGSADGSRSRFIDVIREPNLGLFFLAVAITIPHIALMAASMTTN